MGLEAGLQLIQHQHLQQLRGTRREADRPVIIQVAREAFQAHPFCATTAPPTDTVRHHQLTPHDRGRVVGPFLNAFAPPPPNRQTGPLDYVAKPSRDGADNASDSAK